MTTAIEDAQAIVLDRLRWNRLRERILRIGYSQITPSQMDRIEAILVEIETPK